MLQFCARATALVIFKTETKRNETERSVSFELSNWSSGLQHGWYIHSIDQEEQHISRNPQAPAYNCRQEEEESKRRQAFAHSIRVAPNAEFRVRNLQWSLKRIERGGPVEEAGRGNGGGAPFNPFDSLFLIISTIYHLYIINLKTRKCNYKPSSTEVHNKSNPQMIAIFPL